MIRSLWSLVVLMAVAACASGKEEQRPVSEAPPPQPATAPAPSAQAAPPAPATPEAAASAANERAKLLTKDAQDALSRTQARLDEASREQLFARSELDGARQDVTRAQQQAEAANRSDDALARARAMEAVESAMERSQVAEAHASYAERLVAARSADVDAARAHVAVVELQISPATDPAHSQRIADATRAEELAKARALELGQSALASQRQWQALAQGTASRGAEARPGSPTPPATESGMGSGASQGAGSGAPAATPAPAPAPAPTPTQP